MQLLYHDFSYIFLLLLLLLPQLFHERTRKSISACFGPTATKAPSSQNHFSGDYAHILRKNTPVTNYTRGKRGEKKIRKKWCPNISFHLCIHSVWCSGRQQMHCTRNRAYEPVPFIIKRINEASWADGATLLPNSVINGFFLILEVIY